MEIGPLQILFALNFYNSIFSVYFVFCLKVEKRIQITVHNIFAITNVKDEVKRIFRKNI